MKNCKKLEAHLIDVGITTFEELKQISSHKA
jgi:hypothetical protein